MEGTCPHCSGKHKERDDAERKDLMNRLKRIEGQVRGVEGMLESDAYCTDILIQVSAYSDSGVCNFECSQELQQGSARKSYENLCSRGNPKR